MTNSPWSGVFRPRRWRSGRFPGLGITAPRCLPDHRSVAQGASLPPYSDGIAQDFHLLPF